MSLDPSRIGHCTRPLRCPVLRRDTRECSLTMREEKCGTSDSARRERVSAGPSDGQTLLWCSRAHFLPSFEILKIGHFVTTGRTVRGGQP
nr:MAG TPA_asm: hypothetical protein [Caudoviricetes sp.]